MGFENESKARIRDLERQNLALTEKNARLESKLALAEKERDDALKTLGKVYVAKIRQGVEV